MGRLDELKKEYRPDGVEFKPLWSVTIWDKKFNAVDRYKQPIIENYKYLLAKDLFSLEKPDGDVFLLSTGEQTGWTTERLAGQYLKEGEVVTIPWGKSRAVTDCIKYYKGKFVTADNRIATSYNTNILLNKYLYYWMMSEGKVIDSFYRGSGIKHPDMAKVLDMRIPIPPLEVQREIVRVLDNFTKLTAEHTAELTARHKQLQYSFDKIISLSGGKQYYLEEVCQIVDCPHSSPMWRTSGVPVIRNFNMIGGTIDMDNLSYVDEEEYRKRIKRIEPKENDILFSREAPIGNVAIVPRNFKCCQGQRVVLLRANGNILDPRYLLYYLQGDKVREQIKKAEGEGSTVSNFNIADLKKLKIVIPTLDIQNKMMPKLLAIQKYLFSVNEGIPAEMAARKKQYEYYRNKLLSFGEL